MTFKEISIKMFKAHARRYLSFFLCSSFTIMVFFMFSSIYFNNGINRTLKSSTKDIFNATLVSILIFSVLFLGYAYTSFSKSRKKEFGLFLILGMSNRSIGRMLLIEHGLIAAASLVTGLIAGTVFSRLFFLIVVNLLNLEKMQFLFFRASYISTILLFLVEFVTISSISSVIAGRAEIIDNFKSSRINEKDWFDSPLLGISGLFLFSLSFGLKYVNTLEMIHVREMSTVFVIICFTGLYFTISQFGNALAFLFERNKSLYYKNLPGISGIRHKIFRSKTVLFLTTMLSAITVYLIGTAFSCLLQATVIAERDQPWHLAYIERQGAGNIPEQELQNILTLGDVKPSVQKKLELIEAEMQSEYRFNVTVLSNKGYNDLDKENLAIKSGHYVLLCPAEMALSEENRPQINECILTAGSDRFRFELQKQMSGQPLNKINSLNSIILVLNDLDYSRLKISVLPSQIGYLRLVNYQDWRRTSEISKKLESRLDISDTLPAAKQHRYGDFPSLGSRIGTYEKIRSEGSLLLFLTVFLGLLFFISSASVISFKLFSEIEEEREKYRKFFYIGIRKKEFRNYLSGELGILFFLPPVIGALMALLYIYIDLKNSPLRFISIADLSLVTMGYLLFQMVFCAVTKRRFAAEIMDHFGRSESL